MPHPITIHPDIIKVLSENDINEFKVPKVRDLLLATSMQNKKKNSVRLFVSRHLNTMVEQGYLTSTGTHRNKVFRKTKAFAQIGDIGEAAQREMQQKDSNSQSSTSLEVESHLIELEKIRNRLNAELAMLMAEIEEYRSIIKQFPQTRDKVRRLHEQSTQQSATLTGKITAITKTIDLFQVEAA